MISTKNKLARRRTREGREIEEQKKKKAYVTRKVRRQEGQKARMPVDKKTSLLDGKKIRWLENQMAGWLERQKSRYLEGQRTIRHKFSQLNMDYQKKGEANTRYQPKTHFLAHLRPKIGQLKQQKQAETNKS